MEKLRAWARQPTTVAGISTLIATVSALLLQQLGWQQAIPLLVGSAVSMVLPDNTGARQEAQQLASDVVSKITNSQGKIR